jgi:hypothetical protein
MCADQILDRFKNGSCHAPVCLHPSEATSYTADDLDDYPSSNETAVFLIVDGNSMAGRSWPENSKVLNAIMPICPTLHADGIDAYFRNMEPRTVTETVNSMRPAGGYALSNRMDQTLQPYARRCEEKLKAEKPLSLAVVANGNQSDHAETSNLYAFPDYVDRRRDFHEEEMYKWIGQHRYLHGVLETSSNHHHGNRKRFVSPIRV